VRHKSRAEVSARRPRRVTLEVVEGLPLRSPRVRREVAEALRGAREREGFRLVRCSLERGRATLTLLVSADDAGALGRGMKSLTARFARAVNRALGRSGAVLRDRYRLHD
jgi:hypothetical protein